MRIAPACLHRIRAGQHESGLSRQAVIRFAPKKEVRESSGSCAGLEGELKTPSSCGTVNLRHVTLAWSERGGIQALVHPRRGGEGVGDSVRQQKANAIPSRFTCGPATTSTPARRAPAPAANLLVVGARVDVTSNGPIRMIAPVARFSTRRRASRPPTKRASIASPAAHATDRPSMMTVKPDDLLVRVVDLDVEKFRRRGSRLETEQSTGQRASLRLSRIRPTSLLARMN